MLNLIEIRKKFHQYPETPWTEFWTTAQICEYLESFGFDLLIGEDIIQPELRAIIPPEKEIEYWYQKAMKRGAREKYLIKMKGGLTGVIGILDTGKPGPVVSFRADIDALFLTESTKDTHIPAKEGWSSQNEGKSHGCGHDVHTTIGLGIAEYLGRNRDQLKGKFIMIFSPAEEGGHGCLSISRHPIIQEIQCFLAIHIGTGPFGDQPFIIPDCYYRSVNTHKISFESKQYQYLKMPEAVKQISNNPDLTLSQKMNKIFESMNQVPGKADIAIKAACTAISNLHMINRRHDGISIIKIGQLHAGMEGYGLQETLKISDPCSFDLTIRGDTDDITKYTWQQALHVLETTADMYNVSLITKKKSRRQYPAWHYNSPDLIELVKKSWEEMGFGENIIEKPIKEGGTDDAIYIMQEIQKNRGSAIYFFLGSANPDGTKTNVHNPDGLFDVMPETPQTGVDLITRVFKHILEKY